MAAQTQGLLPELEGELETEQEDELFLGGLARQAAQAVLGSLTGQQESEFEGEFEDEGEFEAEFEDEFELEYEDEGEFEDEGEALANPLRRVYPEAMLEHLGHAAAEAESEAEAEAFIGALVPLAANLIRGAAPAVARATPHLVRGLANVTRRLRRNPATRPLVRAVPTIVRRTTAQLARQVARGRPITARGAVRTLAGQTAAVLGNPRRRTRVIQRARAVDRTYHRMPRTTQVPVVTPRPGYGPVYRRRPAAARGIGVAWIPVPAWTAGTPPTGW
jgi:hypothetical protein